MKIYLDVCCLNRPFDDPADLRIAAEASAVLQIFELIEAGYCVDYSSEMARLEIGRIPDADRRRRVTALLPPARRIIELNDDLLDGAEKLVSVGFGVADAVHLSCAAELEVDVFLTVDDKLLRRSRRYARRLNVRVIDPSTFAQEINDDTDR